MLLSGFLIHPYNHIRHESNQQNCHSAVADSNVRRLHALSRQGGAITGYNVYRTDNHGNPPYVKLNNAYLPGFTYTDTIPASLSSGQFKYVITDVQKNLQDNTILCEASGDTLLVDYSLGINAVENPAVRIFPQPANEHLTIQSQNRIGTCELFNIVGEKILSLRSEGRNEITINVSSLPAGIYILRVHSASGSTVMKLSIVH